MQFLLSTLITALLLSACKQSADISPTDSRLKNTDIAKTAEPAKVEVQIKPQNKPDVINFDGFGPAKFGDNEESVRMAWGRPLTASKPAKGATCYYLNITPNPDKKGIAFMLENAKFVRYDVKDNLQIAPGNIAVGDSADTITQAYAQDVKSLPHKYIEGARTLIVTPAGQKKAKLIFEVDADNKVMSWRIGVPPQVDYVEGCS